MGFVGGSGNITIVLLPYHVVFVLIAFKYSLIYGTNPLYFLCLPGTSVSRCGDKPWPPGSGSWCLPNTLQECVVLSRNLSNLTLASSHDNLLLCSDTLLSDRHHTSELLVPGFGHPVFLCQDGVPRSYGMAAYVRNGYGEFRHPKFDCGFYEMLVFRVCGARQNFYLFSWYHVPDHDDRIYEYLLKSMAAVQAVDVCASFLFMGNLNGHHQDWLGSTSTNRHGVCHRLCNCIGLWSTGDWPNSYMWRNS